MPRQRTAHQEYPGEVVPEPRLPLDERLVLARPARPRCESVVRNHDHRRPGGSLEDVAENAVLVDVELVDRVLEAPVVTVGAELRLGR